MPSKNKTKKIKILEEITEKKQNKKFIPLTYADLQQLIKEYVGYKIYYPDKLAKLIEDYSGINPNNYFNNILFNETKNTNAYDQVHKRYKDLYFDINKFLVNYRTGNIIVEVNQKEVSLTPKDTVMYLIEKTVSAFNKSKAIATACFQKLGIYSLPPPIQLLKFLIPLLNSKEITHIIDYGAGVGLWASIFSRYYESLNKNVIAYDTLESEKNPEVYHQPDFFPICTQINLDNYPINSTLILLLFPDESICNSILSKTKFKYILFQGDNFIVNQNSFFNKLNKLYKIIKVFDPIAKLSHIEQKVVSGIYLLKRRKKGK